MKICPNCGQVLPDNALSCPNCSGALPAGAGAADSTPNPAGARRRPGPAVILTAVLLLIAVAAAAVLLLPRLLTSPDKDFVRYQQAFLADRYLDRLETALDTLGTGQFSSDLTLTASVDNTQINRFLEGSSLGLRIDLDQNRLLLNGEAVLLGSPVFSGALTYDKGLAGFSLPQVDGSYYVADLSAILTSLSEQPVDLSALSLPKISGSQWHALLQSYVDVVSTAVTRDNVTLEKKQPIRFNQLSGSCQGSVYTFTPSAEDIEATLVKIAEHLRQDEELRALIVELVNPDALRAAFGPNVFQGRDLEASLDDALTELADNLEEQATYLSRKAARSGFTWTLALEGKQVRMIRIEANGCALVYEGFGSESQGLEEALYYDDGGSIEPILRQSCTRSGSTRTGSSTLHLDEAYLDLFGAYYYYDSPVITVDYQLDESKKSPLGVAYGTYDIVLQNVDLRLNLEVGAGAQGGSDHTFTYLDQSGELFGGAFRQLTLNINASEKSTAQPPSGQQVDITNYSEEELSALFSRLGTALQEDLLSNLMPLLFSASYAG